MATTRRQRATQHARFERYCSCGKVVFGNGGKRHFEMDGHKRVTYDVWRAMASVSARPKEDMPDD